MNQRLGFYTPGSYPVQSKDLLGTALQSIIQNIVVGKVLNPQQSPILAAIPKQVTRTDVIRWSYNHGEHTASVGALEAPALYSNFPGTPDNGAYNRSEYLPLEITVGGSKVNNVVKINSEELNSAFSDGSTDEIVRLFQSRFQLAIAGIVKYINDSLVLGGTGAYTGSPMTGLESIFGGNSYAGLVHTLADYVGTAPGVDYYPEWRPLVAEWSQSTNTVTLNDGHGDAGTLVAPTVYTLSQADNGIGAAFNNFNRAMSNKGRTYNLIVTSPDVAFAYQAAYDMRTTIQIVNGQRTNAEVAYGLPSYNGSPIITDSRVPANTVYFIDTAKLQVLTKGVAGLDTEMGDLSQPFANLAMTAGMLASETIAVSRYEIYCLPQLHVIDTTGINKLELDPVDILSKDVRP